MNYSHFMTPHGKQMEAIYVVAEKEKSFKSLLPYSCLMFKWQMTHRADFIRIATIASHKLNHHKWCDTKEKCNTVAKFIKDYESKN